METAKKTIYLHIGLAKTGTSSLQEFLYKNRELLERKGLSYPIRNTTNPNTQVTNFRSFFTHDKDQKPLPEHIKRCFVEPSPQTKEIYTQQFKEIFLEKIQNSFCNKILLSEEILSNFYLFPWNVTHGYRHTYLTLHTVLTELGFNIKTILYIRPLADWLSSFYGQYSKRNAFKFDDIKTYLAKITNPLIFCLQLIHTLGQENVIIKPYEKCQWKNNNLIEDFLDIFGIPLTEEFELNTTNYNTSYCRNMSELFRIMPRFIPQKVLKKARELNQNIKIVESLSDNEILEIVNKYKPELAQIAQLYGKKSFFVNDFPACYGKERPTYDNENFTFSNKQLDLVRESLEIYRAERLTLLDKITELQKRNAELEKRNAALEKIK